MKSITKLCVLALCITIFAGVASATVACPSESLEYYIANFGPTGSVCAIGDKNFGGFQASLINLGADQVSMIPVEPIVDRLMGFRITGLFALNNTVDVQLMFNAWTANGAARISDVDALISNIGISPGTNGLVQLTEDVCEGGTFTGSIGSPNCSGTTVAGAITLATSSSAISLSDTYLLSNLVSVLGIRKDYLLRAPSSPGSTDQAGFSYTDNLVSQIPEPGTLALIGLGLVGLAGLKRSRRK